MNFTPLTTVSPIDGRYHVQTQSLQQYFSEYALIKYRIHVEVEYFIALCKTGLEPLAGIAPETFTALRECVNRFSEQDAEYIKSQERITNHDVKAVEYFLKEKMGTLGLSNYKEFIHFGLTSQDINNTAIPLALYEFYTHYFLESIEAIIHAIDKLSLLCKDIPMLARTHGQPASPTLLEKELYVFTERIKQQMKLLEKIPFPAKFGGATGNMNAHYAAYPDYDWKTFAHNFVTNILNLHHSYPTTQIEHYDHLAAQFDAMKRINTILIDFCRDIWQYISMEYFTQQIKENEVGSSAMPHKVNPIDFENAEGNLGIANALFEHLSSKLPVSRLQRDLTDSTVLRNIGVPYAHTVIAFNSMLKGIDKLKVNAATISCELEENWAVIAEAIQTILRREQYPKPYEALKKLTRGKSSISKEDLHSFIDSLEINNNTKAELKQITPNNYTGKFVL
jgi:adenylosuccinate lyase